MYIMLYPTACGKPATVPTHVDRSIDRSLARSLDRSIDRSIARWRFPRRSKIDEKSWKIDTGIVPKSFQNRPKKGQNHQKSVVGDPPGRPGDPRTELDGKLSKK